MTGRIRIGVAGWDYPDWQGPVYPPRSAGRIDRLGYISRYVDVLEINATFYRAVAERTAEAWLRRTAHRDGFAFTAKAHRSWTHEGAPVSPAVVAPTLAGLRPLLEAGRLRALLVQFPHSFHFGPRSSGRLAAILDQARGWPLVVEVRHASWHRDEARQWFEGRGAAWCVVDQPPVGRSSAAVTPRVVGRLGYLRLHGRNIADWFRRDAGRDARYDYLYSAAELDELAGVARSMARQAEELIVVQNNHFRGQALVNALQMKHLLQGDVPRAPDSLVTAYPQLEGQVRTERSSLF